MTSNGLKKAVNIQASHLENPLDIHHFLIEPNSKWHEFFEKAEISFKRGCSRIFWNTYQSTGEIYFDSTIPDGFFKENDQVLFTGQYGFKQSLKTKKKGGSIFSAPNSRNSSEDLNENAEISRPVNFVTGISIKTDEKDGSLTGVPSSWQGMIGDDENIKHMNLDKEVSIPEHLKVQRKMQVEGFNPNSEISRPQGMKRITEDTMKMLPPELRKLLEQRDKNNSGGATFTIKSKEESEEQVDSSIDENKKPRLQDFINVEEPSNLFSQIEKISFSENHFKANKGGKLCCIEVVPVDDQTNIEALENQLYINEEFGEKANFPKLVGCFCKEQDLWIVTEFIEGESLEQILKKEKTLKEQEIRKIAKKVLESLKIFEENLIVYGNLACRNILVSEEKLYFTSLLYSVVLNSKGDKIFSDQGNPYYMAPEIIIGKSGYDQSSDIWSFGIILYELAIGVQPYAHLSPMDAMIEIATKPPPSFDEDKSFSSSFVNFVSACLTSKSKKRATVSVLLNHPFITEE